MKKNYDLNELALQVKLWADDRGLLRAKNADRQMLKVMEEVGELAGALAKNNHAGIVDGIGDAFVTLIILAHQVGETPEFCLEYAYKQIANRTGKTESGIFVKDK